MPRINGIKFEFEQSECPHILMQKVHGRWATFNRCRGCGLTRDHIEDTGAIQSATPAPRPIASERINRKEISSEVAREDFFRAMVKAASNEAF